MDLFTSSGERGEKTPTQLGPLERANGKVKKKKKTIILCYAPSLEPFRVLKENNVLNKPQSIFSAQLINPEKLKRRKWPNLRVLTLRGRGKTVTVIAKSNAEGQLLPPILIL
jgi:hypothetical protein